MIIIAKPYLRGVWQVPFYLLYPILAHFDQEMADTLRK